jgi:hypothetical protein
MAFLREDQSARAHHKARCFGSARPNVNGINAHLKITLCGARSHELKFMYSVVPFYDVRPFAHCFSSLMLSAAINESTPGESSQPWRPRWETTNASGWPAEQSDNRTFHHINFFRSFSRCSASSIRWLTNLAHTKKEHLLPLSPACPSTKRKTEARRFYMFIIQWGDDGERATRCCCRGGGSGVGSRADREKKASIVFHSL